MSLSNQITVGIIGGAGYTAGELLRILVNHPNVAIHYVQSDSQDGKPIVSAHKDLIGDTDLVFSNGLLATDVVFLCRGHGASKTFLESDKLPGNPKIIDLSHDYRLNAVGNEFVYGLPEAFRTDIQQANKVANPGCFATCIQLGLLPLAAKGHLNQSVHITAITGSTGAGQSLSSTSHFSWRNNNLSVYKPFQHQHLAEIGQTLDSLAGKTGPELNFIPIRGDFTRGIFASTYLKSDLSLDEIKNVFTDYYNGHPFTFITDENPDLKQVVGTNKGLVFVNKIEDKALIISTIDNLIKGASGQAVQNMNLMFGLNEETGLKLKSTAF